ncbi:PrsW family intramembrane metalloprotease [Pelagibacterium sp. H642]|uniref:PrsW family intramembrane metalloprotease n=1 Tax=Pelagibacterium sp. H642 TaxID=1881069 RepID=UPI002814BFF7|nr:PrsW family intramembrane metalloprotease [Pelagibacterium sp. H642]WMT91960.1 PrsW family intramembrane metalloprotease [Pelagibacterium sp. H642]
MTGPNAGEPALIYRPFSAVFWVLLAAIVTGAIGVLMAFGSAIQATLRINLLLIPVWATFILILVRIILLFDPFRAMRQMPQVLVAALALGSTAAMAMALTGNDAMAIIVSWLFGAEFASGWFAALSAPIIEEASKATCAAIILILCSDRINRIAHALLVGMFVGLGFGIVEDLTYEVQSALSNVDSDLAGALPTLFIRILTAFPSHWSYTGLTSVGVLLLLPSFSERDEWKNFDRLAAAVLLFFSAWFMHFLWDSPAPAFVEGNIGLTWLLLLLKCLVNVAIFLGTALLLLRHERRWVVEQVAQLRAFDAVLPGIDAEVLNSLATRRARHQLQKGAKRKGGKAAARSIARDQRKALDLIQRYGSEIKPAPAEA